MRIGLCLAVLLLLVGCAPTMLDRDGFDQRYADTALYEGVLSSVPPPNDFDPQAPPVVVNWWYAGTRHDQHYLVLRELTWDEAGKPVGQELRYRIDTASLTITDPFDKTRDESRWVALFQASTQVTPPADLVTERRIPEAQRPNSIEPKPLKPRDIDPQPVKKRGQTP